MRTCVITGEKLEKRDLIRVVRTPEGNVVVDYIYDDARQQNEFGYISVKKDGLWGSLDKIVPKDGVMHVYKNIKSDSVTLYEIENVTHDTFKNDRYDEILKILDKI